MHFAEQIARFRPENSATRTAPPGFFPALGKSPQAGRRNIYRIPVSLRPVLVGHVAVGFVSKRAEPRLSLGTCLLAALLADLLLFVFVIAGIERIEFGSGSGAAQFLHAVEIGYSHSLLMGVVWAGLLAGAFYARRHHTRAAAILAAGVLSHWVLDVISHQPDMPLAPGVSTLLGFQLWSSIPATLAIEGGFWMAALIVYARMHARRTRLSWIVFGVGAILLTLAWIGNVAGPPPSNPRVAPMSSLIFFALVVAWGYWLNRLGSDPAASRLRGQTPVQVDSRG
jgi:membrane-bound metal-dependent hydrolase YbcI (DUF457 family)